MNKHTRDTAGFIFLAVVWLAIFACFAFALGHLSPAKAPQSAPSAPVASPVVVKVPELPPCPEEDSEDCIWDATVAGNGEGVSFIQYKGETYYLSSGE